MVTQIMEKLHCSCNIWNLVGNNNPPRKMYFKPNEIFDEERFRKLVRNSKSHQNCIGLTQIMSNDLREISLPSNDGHISVRILISEPQRTLHSSMESIDKFPPISVEPISADTLRINMSVSKVTD